MYTTTLTVDTRIHGKLVPAGTRVQIDDSRFPGRVRPLSGGRWRPVSQARLSIEDVEIDGQAITQKDKTMYTSLTAHLFDLDGTLIVRYMDRPDKNFDAVELLPGVAERWQQIRAETGNNMAIVTNQAGVAFGYQTEADVQRKLAAVGAALGYGWIELHDGSPEPKTIDTGAAHAAGVLNVYVCYNDARSSDPRYQDDCRRKPSGAMLHEAFEIDGYTQYALMVGDRPEDEAAARDAGVTFQWAKDFFNNATQVGGG